ncbi:MAG: helix-hairpin-helix domain-containing protein, partial [bacterium]
MSIPGWKIFKISQCVLWILMMNVITVNPVQAQTEYEEELLESMGEKESLELLEELQELRENPVNINQAGIKELGKIPFLTQLFIQRIIKEREKKGFFSSWHDFKERLQIPEEIWNRIHPYLDIKGKRFENLSLQVRSRFQRNYSNRIHYQDLYPGSVWKMYQRIRISQKDVFNCALLIEKDPGETDPADHVVGFIKFENIYHTMQLLLGTYYIKAGQGIVLWSPYGFSKGVYPVSTMKKRSSDIRGYKSTDENNFLSGAAVAFHHPTFHLLLFGSGTGLDASLNMDGTIKSFPVSGYHRTAYEKETKETVTEYLWGLRAEIKIKYGRWGVTSLFPEYSRPVQRDLNNKNLFSFRGSRNYLYSLDFDLYCNRFNLFGEIAV